MATETKTSIPLHPATVTAAAALTSKIFVTVAGAVCGLNERAWGVTIEEWASGDPACIWTGGNILMTYGDTITAGDEVTSNASGQAIKRVIPAPSIFKSADQAITSSTTLTNDTAFTFSVGASQVVTAEFDLYVANAKAGAQTIKINFTVPTGTVMSGINTESNAAADTLVTTQKDFPFSSDLEVVIDSSETAHIRLIVTFTTLTTPGTITMQWAQKASDAAAITMKDGSKATITLATTPALNGVALDSGVLSGIGRIQVK